MSLWVMAKILATSELEAKESGIFLHFLIFMVFSMLIFSELVRCPDMDHKIGREKQNFCAVRYAMRGLFLS